MTSATSATVLAVFVVCASNIMGSIVTITTSQLGPEQISSISQAVAVAPLSGSNGGEFTATIGSVIDVDMFCIDSQLDILPPDSFTAYIEDLNGQPNSPFDDPNKVRYADVTTQGATGWALNLSGLGLSTPNDPQTRYELAAILTSTLASRIGDGNDATNQAITDAIWRIMDNASGPTPPFDLFSVSDSTGAPSGYTDWVAYAAAVLNGGTFNFSQWAVVSGGYNTLDGELYGPLSGGELANQTFLVELTPEPRLYNVLLVGILALVGIARRRWSARTHL
jgi:hypothetical protein